MNEQLLSVETSDARDIVEIHLNQQGLNHLIDALTELKKATPPEHIHLMSRKWGGKSLVGPTQNQDFIAAHHLKLLLW